jgi:fatty-acyl-CoA synthase
MLRQKVEEARRALEAARWRMETVARVGMKTGMPTALRWEGVKILARELPKGKANPSLAFRFHAANDPHKVALTEPRSLAKDPRPDRLYSFYELDERIDRLAAALRKLGVGKGTAGLVMLKNRPEFLMVQAALGRLGAAAVSVSWRSTLPELVYIAKHSGARALIFDVEVAATIKSALGELAPEVPASSAIVVGGDLEGFVSFDALVAANAREAHEDSEEGAVVMYTSGTTGKPKGAVRKFQRDALPFAMGFIGETPMRVGEVHLAVCPLYHATAFAFCGFTYLLGGSVVVLPEFKPELFLQAVEKYRITTTALVPTMIHRVAELGPKVLAQYDTSSLKCIFSGGAPLTGQLAREAMDVIGDKIWNFYGATETGLVTCAGPEDLRASPGTIGRAVPGNEIRLLDDDGREVAEGAVGELYVRSPALVEGYHADQEATARSMREGFFSVGDLARRDARGCFHIEGRKRDMIISGGVNVYPAEVEAAIESHASVSEVAVVGAPDPEWGERVRAFIVPRQGHAVDPDALKAWCKGRLASYKVPRDFIAIEALPRNPTGKVLKRELR